MAANQPLDGTLGGNIIEMAVTDANLAAKVKTLMARILRTSDEAKVEDQLDEIAMDAAALKSLMLTFVNGQADLPQQRVQVEYLKSDQRMLIPMAMGMLPYASVDPEVPMNATLVSRYWRVTQTPFHELLEMIISDSSVGMIRTTIDAKALPAARTELFKWPDVYVNNEGDAQSATTVALVYARISNALQFNCDLRDFGILSLAEMRLSDDAWKNVSTTPWDRYAVKVNAYSLQMIAALNVTPCANVPLAAWTRAYGVSVGALPVRESKLQKEYTFVGFRPSVESRKAAADFEEKTEEPIYPIAMNLLAMFGLFHLAKDHTYRSGDANMDRIGMSYLTTLRTMVHSTLMDTMKTQQEALVRTAQHPFGLGQTYAIAKHMSIYQQLATPLRLRVSATPPPVQRLFIIVAAKDEWCIMPIGTLMNDIFGAQLKLIYEETLKIQECAPAYSGLYELYGLPTQLDASHDAYVAATALLPVVYGYAMVQHSDSNEKKEGLALALSLQNVASHHKTMATQWQRLWEAYVDKADKEGLETFLRSAYNAAYQ